MERAIFGSILEQRVEVHKAGRNVVTSQRRDVGSTRIEVNKRRLRLRLRLEHLSVSKYRVGVEIHSTLLVR